MKPLKFHNLLFAVVSAACSAPLLGNSKATCNGKKTNDYTVDYGVEGSTITVCIQNEKDTGWIALGPGDSMTGTVVGYSGDAPPSSWSIEAFMIQAGDSNNLNAKNFVAEVKNGKPCMCFDFPEGKIKGVAASAKFQWARGKGGEALNPQNKHAKKGTFVLDLTDLVAEEPAESPAQGPAESPAQGPAESPAQDPVAPLVTVPPAWSEDKMEIAEPSFLNRNKVPIAGVLIALLAGAGAYYYYYYLPQQEEALAQAQKARDRAKLTGRIKPFQQAGVKLRAGKRARRRP